MKVFDDLGREIEFNFPPERIISLVPSITELLFDLELDDKIVGVTKYCIKPDIAQTKTVVGGTKNADLQIINDLKPDIIFAEKSENFRNNILKIAEDYPVYVFEVNSFDAALRMIRKIGKLTNTDAKSRIISDEIIRNFAENPVDFQGKTVFFPVWKKPYFTISGNTFINSMLEICNLKNIFAQKSKPYPKVTAEELKSACPDYIFLPSEPCTFTVDDVAEFLHLCPKAKIINVDGQMFAWYGSRMIYAAEYFVGLRSQL